MVANYGIGREQEYRDISAEYIGRFERPVRASVILDERRGYLTLRENSGTSYRREYLPRGQAVGPYGSSAEAGNVLAGAPSKVIRV